MPENCNLPTAVHRERETANSLFRLSLSPRRRLAPGFGVLQGQNTDGSSSSCLTSRQNCGDLMHTFIDDLVVQAVQGKFKAV
jgi:hypothetical protein